MLRDYERAKESLRHVYWIGGGAAGGKTTVSRRLCEEFGFRRFAGDGRWIEHWQTATPETNPISCRIGSTVREGGSFEWFFGRTGQEIADDYVTMARVEFEDAIDELTGMPSDRPIVVDAFLGLPELVLKVAEPQRAVFLVSTDDFMREAWKLRTTQGRPGFLPILTRQLDSCTDPRRALESFIESNVIQNRFVAAECRKVGATLITTGGSISLGEACAAVKRHFQLDRRERVGLDPRPRLRPSDLCGRLPRDEDR